MDYWWKVDRPLPLVAIGGGVIEYDGWWKSEPNLNILLEILVVDKTSVFSFDVSLSIGCCNGMDCCYPGRGQYSGGHRKFRWTAALSNSCYCSLLFTMIKLNHENIKTVFVSWWFNDGNGRCWCWWYLGPNRPFLFFLAVFFNKRVIDHYYLLIFRWFPNTACCAVSQWCQLLHGEKPLGCCQ